MRDGHKVLLSSTHRGSHVGGQLQPQLKARCGQKGLQEHSLGATDPAVPFLASWFSVSIYLL